MTTWQPRLRPLQAEDLPAVMQIEETTFSDDAWPLSFYQNDLRNPHAFYFALDVEQEETSKLAGYAVYWLLDTEAHLMNIAVAPRWQGKHLGEYLLLESLAALQEQGAEECTLEVRVGNLPAQKLYRKAGFRVEGRRRHYYQDNGEDALLMTTPPLDRPELASLHLALRAALRERFQPHKHTPQSAPDAIFTETNINRD